MKLHTGNLYWPTTLHVDPIKQQEKKELYDCIIIGGGMSGLLTAHELISRNLSVALIERHEITEGSTAANTGLLQYSNDQLLHEFIEQIGEEDAVNFYKLCKDALDHIESIANTLPENADFIRRPSIFFASSDDDIEKVKAEYNALNKHQFNVRYWNEEEIKQHGFQGAKAALITEGDAEINPYKFTNYLAKSLVDQGLHIFEQTEVTDVITESTSSQNGTITIQTTTGEYKCQNIIYATGYTSPPSDDVQGAIINRSYVIVSEPLPETQNWYENALIWESASPYLYLRFTQDHRIIIGGRDEKIETPTYDLQKLEERAQQLIEDAKQYIPELNVAPRFTYCATFGESENELPFIGEHPEMDNHYYLLGYGGNGTVYSMLGAKILADLITKNENKYAYLFNFSTKNHIIPKLLHYFRSIINISS